MDPLVAKLLSKLADKAGEKLLGRAVGTAEKVRDAVLTNFSAYFEGAWQRCAYLTTLFDRTKPINLQSLYVETSFIYAGQKYTDREFRKALLTISPKDPMRVFLIVGSAGMGKTIFLKWLFISLFENEEWKVPLFVELRGLNDSPTPDLVTYLHSRVVTEGATITPQNFSNGLASGEFILLLDGLDEVARAKRGRIVKQLLDLQTMYTKLIIVISSRHDHYLDAWSLSRLFYVQPMAKKTVLSLISKLPYDKQLTRQFRDEVDMNLYEEHRSFLSNPLLVSVMLITYGQSGNVPDQMHLFYEQAFEALFYRHDTFKDATFRRVHYTALPINVFRNCLSAFCIITYSKSLFEFSSRAKVLDLIERAAKHENTEVDAGSFLDDCIETICVLQYEGLAIKFTHRSFQEYFAAVYIARDPPIELPRYLDRLLGRVGDNVLMMAWDMNSPLLERSWILPHLIRLSNELHGLDGLAVARKLLGTFTYSAVPSGRFSVSGGTSTERHWEFLCLIEELYTDALPSVRDSIEFNDEDRTAVKAIWDQYRDAYPWGSDKAAIEGMGTSWPSAYAAFRQIAEHMKKFGPTHKTGTLSHAEEIRQRSDAKFEEWARLSHSVGDADVSWFKSTRAFAQFGHLPVEVRRLAISLQSKLDESKHIEEDLFG